MTKLAMLTTVFALASGGVAQSCYLPTIRLSFGNCSFSAANETHVYSTGILLGVGLLDSVCGMTSTVVNSTLIQTNDVCSDKGLTTPDGVEMTPAQCRSRRGGYINRSDVPAASSDARLSLIDLNPGWVNITKDDTGTPFQYAAEAALQIRDNSVQMVEGLITQGQQHTMSHIGLAEDSTLLGSLKSEGLIAAKSWGFDAGSQSFDTPRNGSLVLGGYDASRIDGGWFTYPIPKANLVRERTCPLQVQITQMSFTVKVGNNETQEQIPVSGGNPLTACIEPYDNQFRFPTPYLTAIKRMLGDDQALIDPRQYHGLYDIEPGLVYDAATNISVSISFTIGNGLTIEIPSYELVRPLRGIDEYGVPQANKSLTEVQVYAQEGLLEGPVLGKIFLSQLYMFVNYENSTFSLARQNTGEAFLDIRSSGTCSSESTLTQRDKGTIAMGVILALLLLGLLGYGIYRWWTALHPNSERDEEELGTLEDDHRSTTP